MDPVANIEAHYFANAKTFIQYRTGDELKALTIDAFRKAINSTGYLKLVSGNIVVVLVNATSDAATHTENFRAMMKDVAKTMKGEDTKGGVEVICSFMMTASNVPKSRIGGFEKTFREEISMLRVKRSVISASGLFAFNPFDRAVALDDRYARNLGANRSILRMSILDEEQKKIYDRRVGLNNIPTVQQNEIECIWNNYYEGDIIAVGNLSPTALAATIIRRVTAPVTNHIKETQENPEEESIDD